MTSLPLTPPRRGARFQPPVARRPTATMVRERTPVYEDEGSVRQARGAVTVGRDAWWSAALTVPIQVGSGGDLSVHLTMERHPAETVAGAQRVELGARVDELESLIALLSGVVRQARRDGVVPRLVPPAPDLHR